MTTLTDTQMNMFEIPHGRFFAGGGFSYSELSQNHYCL